MGHLCSGFRSGNIFNQKVTNEPLIYPAPFFKSIFIYCSVLLFHIIQFNRQTKFHDENIQHQT